MRPRPELYLAATLLLIACGSRGAGAPPAGPWSALLVTLDTTRADALACYGGRRDLTPNLDRLAAEGVRYARAQSVAPLTLPSHASMLTGLYPLRHGVRDNGLAPVPSAALTVAELAREAGQETAAFVAAVVLDPSFGLDQGFETFDSPRLAGAHETSHFNELPGDEVVDRALAWFAARDRARRFFVWVHLFDPHGPYEPPPRFSSRAPTQPYLGEVAAADAAIGRLLDALRADGTLDETLVLFAADHGESLGEHNESTHGPYVWQTTMHVPFIVRHPDGYLAGTTSEELVSVADVHPTLVEALGLPLSDGLDGLSLFHRVVPADRGVYFESYNGYLSYGWSPLSGWLDARGKYLHSSEPQFFDLASDPRERVDLIAERADDAAHHLARIEALTRLPALAPEERVLDEGLSADIQKLGYTAVGDADGACPSPLDVAGRPSPQSRVAEQADALRALSYLDEGRYDAALPILQQLVADNPTGWFAVDRLTNCLMVLDRQAEALPLLERMLAEGPQWSGSWFNLGLCYEEAGRPDDAINAYARAAELQPSQPVFLRKTIKLLRQQGREEEAAPFRKLLRELKRTGRDMVGGGEAGE